ncbi:MAG: hemin uptake protein HemP [Planctomycetota bacterium]
MSELPQSDFPASGNAPRSLPPTPPASADPLDYGAAEVRSRVQFADLAGESVEIEIEHAGQIYRLRRTRTDKLLLTK